MKESLVNDLDVCVFVCVFVERVSERGGEIGREREFWVLGFGFWGLKFNSPHTRCL